MICEESEHQRVLNDHQRNSTYVNNGDASAASGASIKDNLENRYGTPFDWIGEQVRAKGGGEEAEGKVKDERFGRRRQGERLGRSGLRGACS